MTPADGMKIAGSLILVSALVAGLMSGNFCTRPAPRRLRTWRDWALALIGARAIYVGVEGADSVWWGVAIWLHLGAWGVAIAWFNVQAALVEGDRCPATNEEVS